ncbi:pirin family protein [Stutzerimonas azotifigens]|uniref:Pirin family protein n=1 Tax=Stutzerimonas azotifigens TaxID=291995 RepID=A0ABR5Z5B6_9GAMM|nr:pirin family protein [Stutzerimonas azotifigens]MBA1275412.1 pirin family protein [Stutzerimonas azotifigens]
MTLHTATASIEQVVLPNVRDIGGFDVRRALPSAQRRMVGPFVFLDSFGPVVFGAGEGMDTRPHPHIGLSTISYLLQGEMLHRDSAGHIQQLQAGEVNLMVAGRGIVHSERSSDPVRASGGTLMGLQAWVALPEAHEETEPGFQHLTAPALPTLEGDGVALRLLAGSLEGRRATTRTFSDLFYADLQLEAGARYRLSAEHIERALYVVRGEVEVVGEAGRFGADQLVVLRPGSDVIIAAPKGARLMLLGGEPLDGPRHIYWNFVSSRQDRILQAAEDWRLRRFSDVPGDDDYIPLPDTGARWRFKE